MLRYPSMTLLAVVVDTSSAFPNSETARENARARRVPARRPRPRRSRSRCLSQRRDVSGKIGVAYAALQDARVQPCRSRRSSSRTSIVRSRQSRRRRAKARTNNAPRASCALRARTRGAGFLVRLIVGELRQGALRGSCSTRSPPRRHCGAGSKTRCDVRRGLSEVARAALTEGAAGACAFHDTSHAARLPMLSQSAEID